MMFTELVGFITGYPPNSWLPCRFKTYSWWNNVRAVYQTEQMDNVILMARATPAQLGLLTLQDLHTDSDSWPSACCVIYSTSIRVILLCADCSRWIHNSLIIAAEGDGTPFCLAAPAAPGSDWCVRGRRTPRTGFHSSVDMCTLPCRCPRSSVSI